MKNKITKK